MIVFDPGKPRGSSGVKSLFHAVVHVGSTLGRGFDGNTSALFSAP